MMVALLLYSYAIGERSSRAIERRCHEDVASRVIAPTGCPITRRSRGSGPVIRTRWRRRSRRSRAVREGRAGVGRAGRRRRDGDRRQRLARQRPAAIRRSARRSTGSLVRRPLADAAEDERLGDARGDELPAELADRRSRLERLRRCREELEAEQAQVQAAYEENLRGAPNGRPSTAASSAVASPSRPNPDALVTAQDQHDRSRLAADLPHGQDARCRATTRKPSRPRPDHRRGRHHPAANDAGQLEPMIVAAAGHSRSPASSDHLERCSPTAATGTHHRSPRWRADIQAIVPTKAGHAHQATHALRTTGSRSRSHRQAARHPRRGRALPPPTADHRAGLRQHQVPQTDRPLPAPRAGGLPRRMAAHRRRPQPPKALAGCAAGRGLTGPPHGRRPRRYPARDHHAHEQTPHQRGLRNSLNRGVFLVPGAERSRPHPPSRP